ncbi:putative carbonic anhydrase 3 [Amphibalanus amphitrite]|uniref:carbonic anhydrase n=1 Tax=Amphibalanus amphitrite TaxID=1232801 RepID=A0A6A4VSN3_AMPAM|nr:putative carbonic anhydrase 3 [Amphibalanus amphitrite]
MFFRETSSAALSRSVSRLETLETELLEAHTRYRDSQRELYQTRSRLSREVAALRSERDTLAVRVECFQRLTAADAQHSALQKVRLLWQRGRKYVHTAVGGAAHEHCAPPVIEGHPCSDVSGLRQSPVAIDSCRATADVHRPLRISNLDAIPRRMTVDNTGDRVAGDVFWAPGETPTITGGRLRGQFVYELYDLHWGANSSSGSEHLIRAAASSAELVSPPTLRELLPRQLQRYVQYEGSFTSVPPCREAATWIVLLEPLRVLELELELLRQLRDPSGQNICTSLNRQLQPLASRPLHTKHAHPGC